MMAATSVGAALQAAFGARLRLWCGPPQSCGCGQAAVTTVDLLSCDLPKLGDGVPESIAMMDATSVEAALQAALGARLPHLFEAMFRWVRSC
jgi:hypothetical protein